MNAINTSIIYLLLGILSAIIFLQFVSAKGTTKDALLPRLPMLVFSAYFLIYWVLGTLYILSDKQYFMLDVSLDALPYSLVIVLLSFCAFLMAFYWFMPRTQMGQKPKIATPAPSYYAAIITSYGLLWILRLYLMTLGLYHKYAFVENLMNVSMPPIVNLFYQVMSFLPFIFIMVSVLYFSRAGWIIPVLEFVNFVLIGWKSGIAFAVLFGVLIYFLYKEIPFRKIIFRPRNIAIGILIAPFLFASFYVTPYVYSRNLLLSENYVKDFIVNTPDFIQYVVNGKESEADDQAYMHTRLAAIDPLTAIVYKEISEKREFIGGTTLMDAASVLVPRILANEKKERYGDDPEEQDALRYFHLSDDDTVGTIILSGYANFGLAGGMACMFLFGAFIAFAWRLILFMIGHDALFINFNGLLMAVYFFTRVLLLEQTVITATLLNVRNVLFILVVFNAIRWTFSFLFLEYFKKVLPAATQVVNSWVPDGTR